MNGVKDKVWFLREGLFAKYVLALVGLVVFVLAVNGALETWISYRGIKASLTDAMSEKADATTQRIQQAMADLERQISWATRAYSNTTDLRRTDYLQLFGLVPYRRVPLQKGWGLPRLRHLSWHPRLAFQSPPCYLKCEVILRTTITFLHLDLLSMYRHQLHPLIELRAPFLRPLISAARHPLHHPTTQNQKANPNLAAPACL